jgi:hypothetical protein
MSLTSRRLKDADQTFNAAPADVFHRIRYGALQIGMVARLPTARHFNIRPRQRYRSQALPQQLVLGPSAIHAGLLSQTTAAARIADRQPGLVASVARTAAVHPCERGECREELLRGRCILVRGDERCNP